MIMQHLIILFRVMLGGLHLVWVRVVKQKEQILESTQHNPPVKHSQSFSHTNTHLLHLEVIGSNEQLKNSVMYIYSSGF